MSRALVVIGESSHPCGGQCCTGFHLSLWPEQVGDRYREASRRITAAEDAQADWDWVEIGEMVIRVDEPDEGLPRYECRNLDDATGRCTIYTRRPRICSGYPGYGSNGRCGICGFQPEARNSDVALARANAA